MNHFHFCFYLISIYCDASSMNVSFRLKDKHQNSVRCVVQYENGVVKRVAQFGYIVAINSFHSQNVFDETKRDNTTTRTMASATRKGKSIWNWNNDVSIFLLLSAKIK